MGFGFANQTATLIIFLDQTDGEGGACGQRRSKDSPVSTNGSKPVLQLETLQ